MLHLVSDENFNEDIVRELLLRHPALDLCRVQDVSLEEAVVGQASPALRLLPEAGERQR